MAGTNFCTGSHLIRMHEVKRKGIFKLCLALVVAGSVFLFLKPAIVDAQPAEPGSQPGSEAGINPANCEYRSINEALRSATYWAGADGAMTIELSPTKTLWLFGDTWITGGHKQGTPHRKMINNSLAIQNFSCESNQSNTQSFDNVCIDSTCWSFWHKGKLNDPESVFKPNDANSYYWPGCGTVYDGKLYLLLKRIRRKDNPDPLFQFDWYADDLLIVSNHEEPPNKWVYTIHPLSDSKHDVEYALACTKDKEYLYSLCYLKTKSSETKKTILARIAWKNLAAQDCSRWQYWCASDGRPQGSWEADFHNAKNLIPDCGPEASLFFHKGLNCFLCVYQPPLSPEVKLRVSRKVEGPWSEPLEIYRVPPRRLKDGTTALTYAAKAHESLSTGNKIVFSYCENPGGLEQHAQNPGVYFPTVRNYTAATEKVRQLLEAADLWTPKP